MTQLPSIVVVPIAPAYRRPRAMTLVCVLLACLPLVAQSQDIAFQDLFNTSMREGVACYRIPSLMTAANGDVLAAIDERVPSCRDLNGNPDINIVMRRSADGGDTWSDIVSVADYPLGQSASDPSMILDRTRGEVFLFYNFMDLEREPGIYYLHVVRSSDHGLTWSPPTDITSQIAPSDWSGDFKFITSGRGIQTRSGRLLHTMVNLDHGLHVFGSDDHGDTWLLMDTPIVPGNESKLVELSDGRLMINSRLNSGGARYVHISEDGGRTWTGRTEPSLPDPGCNASILRYMAPVDGEGRSRLLFANANSTEARRNMTVRISYDEGETWTNGKTVYSGSSAYSSLTVLPNGDIGLLFEKDEYTQNVFARIPLSWLSDGDTLDSGASGIDVARAYRERNEPEILGDFATLLSYPNRARDTADIEAAASFIRGQLEAVGVHAELLQVDGAPPIVYGELLVPDATRTLGIYVHYDGQPVDPSEWTHPPFEPTLYTAAIEAGGRPRPFPGSGEEVDPEWRVYARSAGDDKAPIAALVPVLAALREGGVTPTSNLVFFFDGEEEAGSPHLREYMERYRDRIDGIDIWLFFDGPAHQSGRPQITYGVRGAMGLEVTVYGATRNLHSGHYGNWAPDTPSLLARLLASMKSDDGTVLVDGWYDSADPIGDEEREALRNMPDQDAELRRELGIAWTEGQPATLPERLLLPALTVRGLSGGNTGALAANVIPNVAVASLGIRLVKGNDPAHMRDLIVRHIERQGYHVVSEDPDLETRLNYPRIAKVTGGGGSPAARTSMDNPFARQVSQAAALAAEKAFGRGALVVAPGMGGTLPLYLFTDVAGKPAIIVPVANHDNNQHAADENLRIANLWYAMDLYAALLTMGK